MTKNEIIAEHVVVTFFEAALAYIIVIPTVNWNKTLIAGAIGAGLSAVYNVLRQSTPSLLTPVENIPITVPTVTVAPIPESPPEPPETPVVPSAAPTA